MGGILNMPIIIDGKKTSSIIKDELKNKVERLSKEGVKITLAVIQVGDDQHPLFMLGTKEKLAIILG